MLCKEVMHVAVLTGELSALQVQSLRLTSMQTAVMQLLLDHMCIAVQSDLPQSSFTPDCAVLITLLVP